uniref:Membrane protein a161 n=1 Tax=Mastomys natalensis cytomegalovirus 2 TaxID=2973540 RepID=A0A9Y1IPH6_9BETA|nr:membrane protein a161 [Mastomys natalensis cytomegalovirus 2]WEG69426.1 membrane protein a161 [Mastomys natalensis cytomegalovirus 2]WEG69564.1 membrane protein a161 [Mastomys natalensis cytomegalovirus 2]WEG69702.1 membrane protein a161 [Mastomys natalensis cytomegalovirus 2]WEG71376.1 membrane protein a161 [Mastomys natalensis cytomegalovirus 2]
MFSYALILTLWSVSLRGLMVMSRPVQSPAQPGSVGALGEIRDPGLTTVSDVGGCQRKPPTSTERPSPTWGMFFRTAVFPGCVIYMVEMAAGVAVCIWLGALIAPKRQEIYTTMAATEI